MVLPAWVGWKSLALAGWLTGAILWFGWAGFQIVRFRRLLRFARPAPVELQEQSDRVAERLGITGPAVWLHGVPEFP